MKEPGKFYRGSLSQQTLVENGDEHVVELPFNRGITKSSNGHTHSTKDENPFEDFVEIERQV